MKYRGVPLYPNPCMKLIAHELCTSLAQYLHQTSGIDPDLLMKAAEKSVNQGLSMAKINFSEDGSVNFTKQAENRPLLVDAMHCQLNEHELGKTDFMFLDVGKKCAIALTPQNLMVSWFNPQIHQKDVIELLSKDRICAISAKEKHMTLSYYKLICEQSSLHDMERLNQNCLFISYSNYRKLSSNILPVYIAQSWRRLSDLSAQEIADVAVGIMTFGMSAAYQLMNSVDVFASAGGNLDEKIPVYKALAELSKPSTLNFIKNSDVSHFVSKALLSTMQGTFQADVRAQYYLARHTDKLPSPLDSSLDTLDIEEDFNIVPQLDYYYFVPKEDHDPSDFKDAMLLDRYGLHFNHDFARHYKLLYRAPSAAADPAAPDVKEQKFRIVDDLSVKARKLQQDPNLVGKIRVLEVSPLQFFMSVLKDDLEALEQGFYDDTDPAAPFKVVMNGSMHFALMLARTGCLRPEIFDFNGVKKRMVLPLVNVDVPNEYTHEFYGISNHQEFCRYTGFGMSFKNFCSLLKINLPFNVKEINYMRLGTWWLGWITTEFLKLYLCDIMDLGSTENPPDETQEEQVLMQAKLDLATVLYHRTDEFLGEYPLRRSTKKILAYLDSMFKTLCCDDMFTEYCARKRETFYCAAMPILYCLNSQEVKRAAVSGIKTSELQYSIKNLEESLENDQNKIRNFSEHPELDYLTNFYQYQKRFAQSLEQRLKKLKITLPEIEISENEVLLVPGFILGSKDDNISFVKLTDLPDRIHEDSMMSLLYDSFMAEGMLDFADIMDEETEVKHHICGFSIGVTEVERARSVFAQKVDARTYAEAAVYAHLIITASNRNLKTTDLSQSLFVELPKLKEMPDTYLGLESLLEFNWRLSVGKEFITDEEFKLLLENAGKVIKLHNQYVFADPKILKQYQEHKTSLERINLHLLLLATLTGSYEGSQVQLGSRLAKVKKQIFTSGDTSLPRGLNRAFKLRPYQVRGYSWMLRNARSGIGSILADDMGLGKTVQLIALLQKLKEDGALKDAPALIVAPSSVLYNWKNELKRFAPLLRVYLYHGPQRSHERLIDFDVVISSYGTIRTSYEKLADINFGLIAADEAQKIKNYASLTVKAVKTLKSRRFVALTGTPVENSLSDYWSIMDFVNAGLLGSQNRFNTEIALPIEKHRDPEVIERFKRMTGPFILRRVKTDKSIINDLPDKIVTDEFCTLTPVQASLYQAALDDIMEQIKNPGNTTLERSALVLKLMGSLKQICNTPLQYVSGAEGEIEHNYTAEDSGKVRHLFSLAERLLENGHHTLIFTQYTTMGHLLQQWLKERLNVEVPFFEGSTPAKKRQDLVDEFQEGRLPFLLISLQAGGTGINLTRADAVIHFDLWWNPAVEEQATDRAYRIGQHNNVQVYRFITANTFEEKIDAVIKKKKELSDLTVVSGSKWLGELTNAELTELFALTREEFC